MSITFYWTSHYTSTTTYVDLKMCSIFSLLLYVPFFIYGMIQGNRCVRLCGSYHLNCDSNSQDFGSKHYTDIMAIMLRKLHISFDSGHNSPFFWLLYALLA